MFKLLLRSSENNNCKDSMILSYDNMLNRIWVFCPYIFPTALIILELINSVAFLISDSFAAFSLNSLRSSSRGINSSFSLFDLRSSANKLAINRAKREPRPVLKLRSASLKAGKYTHWISFNGSISKKELEEFPPHLFCL